MQQKLVLKGKSIPDNQLAYPHGMLLQKYYTAVECFQFPLLLADQFVSYHFESFLRFSSSFRPVFVYELYLSSSVSSHQS